MKISEKLNIAPSILTIFLVTFIIGKNLNASHFSWFDYIISFGTLFANLTISILSATGL